MFVERSTAVPAEDRRLPTMPSSLRAAWVLLVSLLVAGAAHAQGETDPAAPPHKPAKKPPPVVMDGQVGLHVGDHDVARKGQVNPIRVILSQNAEPISGRLELRNGDRVTDTLVALPPRGRKAYTLAAPLAPDSDYLESGALSAVSRGGLRLGDSVQLGRRHRP